LPVANEASPWVEEGREFATSLEARSMPRKACRVGRLDGRTERQKAVTRRISRSAYCRSPVNRDPDAETSLSGVGGGGYAVARFKLVKVGRAWSPSPGWSRQGVVIEVGSSVAGSPRQQKNQPWQVGFFGHRREGTRRSVSRIGVLTLVLPPLSRQVLSLGSPLGVYPGGEIARPE